tara:strand:- start:611 stop:1570 length:960 start_codon:yes stop_codon:yes gene_type:complete
MKILVTGCAGFIGFHLCNHFKNNKKIRIVGIDNINDYYSQKLKNLRLKILNKNKNFRFYKVDLSNFNNLNKIFKAQKFDLIINLAAQAGVRHSIKKPRDYFNSNSIGFFNILELSRINNIKKIIYASSSSVYGEQKKFPIKENSKLNPKNIYSQTKKNNEEIAEIYSRIYNINLLGLRFFTVYGEWGRPDMLMIKYILNKKKNSTFVLNNRGNHYRDFTYIRDVILIIEKLIFSKKFFRNEIVNVCSNYPLKVTNVLKKINKLIGRPNIKHQKRLKIEVYKTHGSNDKIKKLTKFKKFTGIDEGLKNLIDWSNDYLSKI